MPRFFVDGGASCGGLITVTGEDARHITLSLRAKPGERFTLCGENAKEYLCRLEYADKDSATLIVESVRDSAAEPNVNVTLYQALIKSDKFETVVQKSVELGVYEIVPVLTDRCVSKPDSGAKNKLLRWNKIAKEAAMQSGRARIPTVKEIISFDEAICQMKNADLSFMCYENEKTLSVSQLFDAAYEKSSPKTFSFIIGPEGGFSEKEANAASLSKIPSVSLGPRILRAETAPLCVLSAIMFRSGNLG